jgi:tetrahydromethanopterin S-methyltransferase subunit B
MFPRQNSKTVSGQIVHRLIQEIAIQVRTTVPMSSSTQEVYIDLKRIVVEQLAENEATFIGMCEMLDLSTGRNEYFQEGRVDITRRILQKIVDSMSADRCTNWGRVITLIAFCCQVAKLNIRENEHSDQFNDIVEFLATYLDNEISNLGGWNTLSASFPEKPHVKTLILKGLVGTFIGLAIWALIAIE